MSLAVLHEISEFVVVVRATCVWGWQLGNSVDRTAKDSRASLGSLLGGSFSWGCVTLTAVIVLGLANLFRLGAQVAVGEREANTTGLSLRKQQSKREQQLLS